MAQNIESHNTKEVGGYSLWLPSRSQAALYLLIASLILVALNFKDLWDYLNDNVLANDNASGLNGWLSGDIPTRVLQVIFWLFIGCMVYVFIWFAGNVINNIRNDIVAGGYVYPSAASKNRYWQRILGYKASFVASLLALAGLLIAGSELSAELARVANRTVQNFSWQSGSLKLAGCWLAMALLIYLLTRLTHLVAATGQAVFKGL